MSLSYMPLTQLKLLLVSRPGTARAKVSLPTMNWFDQDGCQATRTERIEWSASGFR
jgi:hypothetical protein